MSKRIIRFKGHKYNLGRFENFEDACKKRKQAENTLFVDFLEQIEVKENHR